LRRARRRAGWTSNWPRRSGVRSSRIRNGRGAGRRVSAPWRRSTPAARDRARQNADAQARLGQTYSEIGDIINNGYKERQVMIDRGQESWSLMTREQEVYRDPMASGGQVELPNTYNHAWRLQDGTYMMTDNPNLNPNVDMGVNAERLQRAR